MDNDMSIMCMVKVSATVFLYVYLSVPLSHAFFSLCVYTHVHKSGFLSVFLLGACVHLCVFANLSLPSSLPCIILSLCPLPRYKLILDPSQRSQGTK